MDVETSNPWEEKQVDRRREARTSERRSRYVVMDEETGTTWDEKQVDRGKEAAAS
jgi:hypothetical protein